MIFVIGDWELKMKRLKEKLLDMGELRQKWLKDELLGMEEQ